MILQGRLLIDPDERPAPGWLSVEDGRIGEIGEGRPPERPVAGDPGAIICPGFVDAHTHLPQIDEAGCDGLDLLDWLDRVIFPAEGRWADRAVADEQVDRAYGRMVRAGTLGYGGFLTSHPAGVEAVARRHAVTPLNAVVGLSLMDCNAPAALLEAGRDFRPPPPRDARLRFSANPRYALVCTKHLMEAVGREARKGTIVQTHLAEQTRECRAVRELFPEAPHYTAVYDAAGLLTEGTLLAHCVHLAPEEWETIAARGSIAVHCPTANTFLSSGLFDLDAARRRGVRVALGSDVAAGPDVAMPRVARAMIEVAKMRAMTGAHAAFVPRPADAWRQITEGNADALGFRDAGRIAPGAPADLLVLRPPFETDDHLIGRLIYTWNDEFIAQRVLAGGLVDADGRA